MLASGDDNSKGDDVGEVTTYPNGHFCWVDLGTTDVPGARTFYGELFGWEFQSVPAGDSNTYTLCQLDGKDVAGIHQHAEEEGSKWSSYISVDDVEAATAQARVLGASMVVEPLDVPGSARMAVIRDPSRAEVALWQQEGYSGARLVNQVGAWSWNELVTPDLDGAKDFYGQLFGWELEGAAADIPRIGFSLGDFLIAGAHVPQPGEGDDPRWTVSFLVADADESVAQVQELGGSILIPPMEIPIGKFSVVADSAGASFTVAAAPAFRGLDGS